MTSEAATYGALSKGEKVFFAVYAAYFAVLLVVIQYLQFSGAPLSLYDKPMYLIASSNLVVMLWVFVTRGRSSSKTYNLIALGLAFTFVADTFLCLFDSFYGPSDVIDSCGFALFTIAEIAYAVYLGHSNKKFAFTVILWAALVALLYVVGFLTVKTGLAIANISMLTVNMVTAWPWLLREKTLHRWLFAIGLLLFFGCDYSIMFRTLLPTGTALYDVARFLVWLCYVPSQYLLILSYRLAFSK